MADCATVQVDEPFDPEKVTIANCTVSPTSVRPGETVTATATVQNNNPNTPVNATVRFGVVGGSTSAPDVVRTPASGSETGSVKLQFEDGGSYDIDVSIADVSRV